MTLPLSWRHAFTNARVHGKLSRAFLGERAFSLAGASSLRELYAEVFGTPVPELAAAALLSEAETRLSGRLRSGLRSLSRVYPGDSPLVRAFAVGMEYETARFLLAALASGKPPPVQELKGAWRDCLRSSGISLASWPDPLRVFGSGRFGWLGKEVAQALSAPGGELRGSSRARIEGLLDARRFSELAEFLALPGNSGYRVAIDLVIREAGFLNASWAMRQRLFHGLDDSGISRQLIRIRGFDLERPALEALRFLDGEGSESWKYSVWFDEGKQVSGAASSRDSKAAGIAAFESRARRYILDGWKRALRSRPDSGLPLLAGARILEAERRCLQAAFSGVFMNLPPDEIRAAMEAWA